MDRDEFMEIVYETFADEPDNVLANGIIEAADAYVEHEKAQLSQEDATFDLIDRQQAIDGKIIIQRTNGVEIYSDEAVTVGYLKNLPTIQPDPKESWLYDYLVGRLGKSIVDNREEFHKWFERMVWHVKRCGELSEERRSRQWITCSERLPERYTDVLFCDIRYVYLGYLSDNYWVKGDNVVKNVVAWMPLPEPYEEEKNG